jgi:K+-sensing histidine kinase KdpD
VADDCPDANVDPSLALEILVNLIENAHRVSPGGAPLELAARTHPLDPTQVRIEVLDRGPGIPAGVTDPDGNLLAGATSDVAQRGLGLEIARSLAAANGGSIGITPRQGGGTIARVDLPAAPLPVTIAEDAGERS